MNNSLNAVIGYADVIPSITRTGGKRGPNANASGYLRDVRALDKPGAFAQFNVPEDMDFRKVRNNINQSVRRKGAVDFPVVVRSTPETRTVTVYRTTADKTANA